MISDFIHFFRHTPYGLEIRVYEDYTSFLQRNYSYLYKYNIRINLQKSDAENEGIITTLTGKKIPKSTKFNTRYNLSFYTPTNIDLPSILRNHTEENHIITIVPETFLPSGAILTSAINIVDYESKNRIRVSLTNLQHITSGLLYKATNNHAGFTTNCFYYLELYKLDSGYAYFNAKETMFGSNLIIGDESASGNIYGDDGGGYETPVIMETYEPITKKYHSNDYILQPIVFINNSEIDYSYMTSIVNIGYGLNYGNHY